MRERGLHILLALGHIDGRGRYVLSTIPEDWPGEAAFVESEMKRFREWAAWKVKECILFQDSWHQPSKCDLVVFEKKYWAIPSAHQNLLEHLGARLVYSPEEGA